MWQNTHGPRTATPPRKKRGGSSRNGRKLPGYEDCTFRSPFVPALGPNDLVRLSFLFFCSLSLPNSYCDCRIAQSYQSALPRRPHFNSRRNSTTFSSLTSSTHLSPTDSLPPSSSRDDMGCSQSIDAETRQQQLVNKQIEDELKRARNEESRTSKMLLLGAGESGKSTLLKQMRLM